MGIMVIFGGFMGRFKRERVGIWRWYFGKMGQMSPQKSKKERFGDCGRWRNRSYRLSFKWEADSLIYNNNFNGKTTEKQINPGW